MTGAPTLSRRVLMVASEAVPFAKTGGLADVTTALSRALARRGHEVTLVLPGYRGTEEAGEPAGGAALPLGSRTFNVTYRRAALGPRASAVLVDCPDLFERDGPYRPPGGSDYPDNPLRFAVLARAALDVARRGGRPPHVVHAHDWQGALAAVFLRQERAGAATGTQRLPATVQTIHNLAYQGLCDRQWLPALGLPPNLFTPAALEFHGRLSLLKGGIVFSDRVTTVSPTHAREVTSPEHGCGLDGLLRARGARFSGVLNGIDTDEWDPARDPLLPATYSADALSGKTACKRALLERFGLPAGEDATARPLVGMISRLVEQKGHGLVAPVADALVALGVTFVVMGEGEERFERLWRDLAARWPGRVALHAGYDEPRAHLIQGGADVFLLPSLFEPCGLSQMYAQRYGTLPVVRATGGLADTVEPFDPRTGLGTGFAFADATPHALLETMRYAVGMRADRRAWEAMQRRAMGRDFSWDRSAGEYERIYEQALTE